MSKLLYNETDSSYEIYCPGCNTKHKVFTKLSAGCTQVHKFDGNLEKPTFSPSVLIDYGLDAVNNRRVCHFFVSEGSLNYQNCFHIFKNREVPLKSFSSEPTTSSI
jgi:hypothetical protein